MLWNNKNVLPKNSAKKQSCVHRRQIYENEVFFPRLSESQFYHFKNERWSKFPFSNITSPLQLYIH